MKILILLFTVSILSGCAAKYHSYYKQGQDTPWDGPFYGATESFEENVKTKCKHSLAFTTPYAVRIHFEDNSETRTYICSEYPNYK